jgi:hypothetical protein
LYNIFIATVELSVGERGGREFGGRGGEFGGRGGEFGGRGGEFGRRCGLAM